MALQITTNVGEHRRREPVLTSGFVEARHDVGGPGGGPGIRPHQEPGMVSLARWGIPDEILTDTGLRLDL